MAAINEWLAKNVEWVFGGIGITALTAIINFFKKDQKEEGRKTESPAIQITTTVNQTQNQGIKNHASEEQGNAALGNAITPPSPKSIAERKNFIKVLFIDDDVKFKVIKILIKSGWIHTKIIKDADTLETPEIIDAHLIFVDIQKVGVAMGFNDEGLGLSLALKKKYPSKKIIIYSAESDGNRFHQALQKADASLEKNADPYEFQKLVEDLSEGYSQ